MIEEWRKIEGFPQIYEVSNFGEVRSWSHMKGGGTLRQKHNRDGYPMVRLPSRAGKVLWFAVHKLVTEAFPEEE